MRRSTTFAGTERPLLGLLLIVELIVAVTVLGQPAAPTAPAPASSAPVTASSASTRAIVSDGRTVELMSLGGAQTGPLLDRIAREMDGAINAVTAFWGDDWPRDVVIVATDSDEQFSALAGGGPDIAAATTAQRIAFAPGAADMTDDDLRIVVRHELFHYAARSATAPDAPRWLTEGVADFVGRPATPRPGPTQASSLAHVPTDADLDTAGPTRTLAYDRAWWFARYVADRYGAPTLRRLYERACGPGHPDAETAVAEILGADLDHVLADWRAWLAGAR
jgi:hypothetical protein